MSRMSLSRQDYEEIGKTRGLELVGNIPYTVYEKTEWRCLHCGKVHVKTYRAVKKTDFGCRCQNGMAFGPDHYIELAKELGITWSGQFPGNARTATQWTGANGQIVNAAYKDLAYGVSKKLRSELGI